MKAFNSDIKKYFWGKNTLKYSWDFWGLKNACQNQIIWLKKIVASVLFISISSFPKQLSEHKGTQNKTQVLTFFFSSNGRKAPLKFQVTMRQTTLAEYSLLQSPFIMCVRKLF